MPAPPSFPVRRQLWSKESPKINGELLSKRRSEKTKSASVELQARAKGRLGARKAPSAVSITGGFMWLLAWALIQGA